MGKHTYFNKNIIIFQANGYRNLLLWQAIFTLILILATPVTAANVTKVEIRGVVFDEKSATYNTTLQWDAQNFTAFWYNIGGGKSSETLTIAQNASNLTNASRIIEVDNLTYKTQRTDQAYTVFREKGKKVTNGLEYNSTTKTFTKGTEGSYYARLGWFGDIYIALNGKANKLTKLVKEQTKSEKKTFIIEETWDIGEGYSLTAKQIDAKTSPRQAHLILSKDGTKLDDKILTEGQVYTYIQNLAGEKDVPVFVTYIDSIFAGATGDMLQLRYTWLISQNVKEIKAGDEFGSLEAREATDDYLILNNSIPINLAQNSVIDLAGDIKFKVADSSTLRFYPIVEKTLPGKYEIRGGIYDQSKYTNLVWDAQRFPAFWYNFGSGKSTETLTINQNASNLTNASRTLEEGALQYRTSRSSQNYTVFSAKGLMVERGLNYNSTTKTFTNDATGNCYARLGWFGTLYVALNGKANKLTKLVKEQARSDKQTLMIGETWDLGEGFSLTAVSIDSKTSPRQAHLIFTKDGIKLDDKVIIEGMVYTYVQSLYGETDVPVFVTYVDSIFAGATSDMVQLRYTWLISRNVIELKTGDELGALEVNEATEDYLLLKNPVAISLSQNAIVDLGGEMKIKVADSSTALRFYPYTESTIQETSQVEVKTSNNTNTTSNSTSTATNINSTSEPASSETAAPETANTTMVANTSQNSPASKTPGFEASYAIAGLAAVAFLVIRKKDVLRR